MHLAYELHITNFRAVDVALARVDVLAGDRNKAVLASYQDAKLAKALARVGARPDLFHTRVIGQGMRVVLFVWLALENTTPVPSVLEHRISFTVRRARCGCYV